MPQNPDSDSCFVTITTSIQELEKTSPIKIFPNPFVDFLTIEYLERDHHFTEITIFNSLGQMVHQQKDELIITKVNTSQLTTGIYYLVLKDNAGAHFSHRMIKR